MAYSFQGIESFTTNTYYFYQYFSQRQSVGIPNNNSQGVLLRSIGSTLDIGNTNFLILNLVPETMSSGGILLNVPFVQNGDGSYLIRPFTNISQGFLYAGLRFTHFSGEFDLEFSNTSWVIFAINNGVQINLDLNQFRSEFTLTESGVGRVNPLHVSRLSGAIPIRQDIVFVLYTENFPSLVRILPWLPAINYPAGGLVFDSGGFWMTNAASLNQQPGTAGASNWTRIGDVVNNAYEGFHIGDIYLSGGARQAGILSVQELDPDVSFAQYTQDRSHRAIVSPP